MNELIGKIVVIKRNGADGPQFPLRTTECFFGRKPACDIRIQLPNVSLEHAVVKVDGKDKIRIINLSSTNQTLVNGKPITEAEVKHLDVFTISDRSFRFEFASPVLKRGKDKSPKTKIRRSVSLVKTPPEGQSPKMPVALKGSPRTPTAGKSLKENIHRLRRFSMPLQEEDENLSSPVSNKPPLSTIFVNAEPQDKSNHQESTEQVNVVKPVEVVKEETRRNSKRVSFGPVLSPEHFDKDLPPATPVRRGSTPKRAASSTKRRRSVLLVPKTDCIKEDDGDVEDFFMTEDVDSNAKSLKEHHISPEEDSHESESVRKESTAVQEKVPGSIRDTPERGQPSSELITPKSTKPKSRRRSSSLVGEMKLELTETSRVTTASDTVTEESKNARRSSLRLAQKSPVQRSIAPETAATASNDDEDIDETILDSDDYTSDEEDPVGGEGKETGQSKLGKALKEEEVKQQKAKKMATPMKNEIANGVNLRQTKKKMTTPLRKEIEEGVKLHETKKRMATPLKKDIENGTNLRQTKKKMATPLKKEIKERITLQQTKKMMATPLKKEIETGTSLRETKKKLATPLKKEIENGTNLRETKKRLATPLKKEIENGTNLRQTKKMMGTPLKKEIETGTSLRETKKKLATPLKKEIENGTSLRQTKKMMGTPLKKEIKEGIKLHQTKKTMATPLKKEIKNGTSLRQTKKKMATPLRTEILEGVKLRETKKKLQTPVRKAIEDGVTLKKTKSKLSTPLRKAIQAKPELRQTKKIMNVLLQDDIKQGVNLRKTKQSMPLEVQIEIIKGKKLRSTKKSLPTPVKNDISGGVTLRKTKKSLPTPLKEQIKKGLPLQKTKKSLPTPVRKQLEGKVTMKSNVKSVKRKRSEGGLNEHDAKRMKTSPSEEVNEESEGFQEAPVRRALKTPLRKAIIAGRKLRPTRHRMATPLRTGIHSRPALRAVRRKSSSVRDEIGPRKPTYAEIVKRATKTAVRRSSKGNSFKFGKTAPICKKAESVPPANVADVVATDHEVPSKPVNDSQAIQKRRSARLDGKAVPQAIIDSVGVLNSPQTDENAPHSTWMSSLARATNGVKARAKPVEDFEGLVEMFATPPMVGISKKDTSKQQKGSNWLSSLAKATKAPRKRGIAVEDFEGVPEMFATPPSISVATPRTTAEDELTSSPEEQDLHLTESLKLSKTPSLRSFGEDTEFVQIVTPIHSSHTPSLRSRNAQTIKSAVTPELLLEMKEALMTQKTPSLRSSAKDAVTVEVVTPLQPSRTPSLRSAMQQTSVFSSESPDIKMDVIKPIAPTKTPSIRSSAQVKAVSAVNVKKPSTSDRKSLGLQGLARLMKVPKENNAVENVEDFFAPSVFASPKPEPKRYSRKSEGLQGVARLLRTPGDMGEGAAVESPKFDGIKEMMRTEKAVASPNFVGLRALMQTPKDSKRAVDLEEHFISDLFLLPVEDSFQDTVQSVVQGECDKEQDVWAINLISPESEEKTAEASEDVSSETVQRVTRAKRKPPEKLPEPVPKRGRTTRAAAKQSSESKKSPSNLKVVQRKTTTRSKKSSAASLPSTPKPLEFKRTQLDPIIEVLSPLPAIDQTVEVAASPTLVEPEATEKAFTRGGAEETTDFKAQQTEPSRCSRRGIRAKARVDSSSGECSGGEVAEKRVATKRRTRAKVEEDSGSSSVDVQKADVETGKSGGKGRATRSSQLKEAPSQNVKLPRTTRSGRNRRAEVAEVEDKVVIGDAADETINNSTTTRSRRKARTTEESASVMSEEESVRNGKVQQNDAEATKVRRTRSRRTADKNNTVNEDKLAQSSQAKRTKKESVAKADEETQSEEKEASSKQRSTRRTRGNPIESIVPESTAASLQEVENFQSKSSVKNVRGKREPKGKALEEPRTTRSSRSANPAKIKPTVEPQLPVRSTRGRKRQLGEEEVAEPAVPEAKRKRSSARARDVEPPQTRSLRSRK